MLKIEKPKNIYYKLHAAGLINQVYSVELGLGIGFVAKRKVIFTKVLCNPDNPVPVSGNNFNGIDELTKNATRPLIFDLLNLPHIEFCTENKTIRDMPEIKSIISYYMKCQPSNNPIEEKFFAEERPELILPNNDVHLREDTLAVYSRFFYNRTKELDAFLSTIQFRKEYQKLAYKIAQSIGPFKGMHVRLTDHAEKMYHASEDKFTNALKYFSEKPLPFVICSDEEGGYLSKYKKYTIFLGKFIIENFSDDFKKLPFHDKTVFGLINLLVMTYAEEFVGTPGSTFSAYIQRLRINKGLSKEFHFIDDPDNPSSFTKTGPYSWNGYNMHTNTKCWWREWDECKLNLQ